MQYRRRTVSYAGHPFSFERIERWEAGGTRVVWAVSRSGEFIGYDDQRRGDHHQGFRCEVHAVARGTVGRISFREVNFQ